MCTDRQTGRYLDASLHYQTRGSSQWERARERDDEDRKPFPVHRHHRPFGEKSMWPPLAVYQSFSFPHFLILDLPRGHSSPNQLNIELYVRCEKKSSRNHAIYHTYQRISILILRIQFTSRIIQAKTIGETTECRIDIGPIDHSRLLSVGKREERLRVTYYNSLAMVFILIKTCVFLLRAIRDSLITAWFAYINLMKRRG